MNFLNQGGHLNALLRKHWFEYLQLPPNFEPVIPLNTRLQSLSRKRPNEGSISAKRGSY